MKVQNIVLNEERNVFLTAYIQEVGGEFSNIPARPAVFILPGGGYQLCSGKEADPVAMAYLKAGYHAFILHYSIGEDSVWPNPLDDYEKAMELLRNHAEEWKLYMDKIAVIGFSAGGHLAACAATMSENRPNAAILGYPVLNEQSAHTWNLSAPDTVGAVDRNTCPCFVFASRTDTTVPINNTLQFLTQLDKQGIAFESHIYAYAPHGFATGDSALLTPGMKICNRVPHWVSDSIEWLKDMFGDFGNGEMTKPMCPKTLNGNHGEFLSVDCTMGHLLKNPASVEIVGTMLHKAGENKDNAGMAGNLSKEQMQMMMQNMTLREMLQYGQVPETVQEQINAQLMSILNEY